MFPALLVLAALMTEQGIADGEGWKIRAGARCRITVRSPFFRFHAYGRGGE